MWLRGFLILSVSGAAPAMAQQSPSRSQPPTVEHYLCTFAGKCDAKEAAAQTRDAPATKGFRLARPGGSDRPALTGSVARPAAKPATRAYAPAARPARVQSYGARPAVAPVRSYASGGPRADLMIGFELGSARLTRDGSEAARIFAQSMLRPELQGKRFLIEGHTDSTGGQLINGPLSASRAQAVADYLVSLGVERSRIVAQGFGAERPLEGRNARDPANRRVEAELIP